MKTDVAKNQKQDGLKAALAVKTTLTGQVLDELLDKQTEIPMQLKAAMDYMLQSGGKRIRSALVMWCCELVAGRVTPCGRDRRGGN